jgi:hypothetical protein
MGLGNVSQNMQSITEAKIAGKIAFDIMNHESEVKLNNEGTVI